MTTEAIVRSLLEDDGSCRDINFSEYISTSGACSLFDFVGARWTLTQATDVEGNALCSERAKACLLNQNGALSTLWDGPTVPHRIQAYFHWACIDQVFCELTFFPEDLDPTRFELDEFLRLVALLVRAAKSQEYYVRLEDASWSHAKGNKESVIFSHKTMPL